MHARRRSLAHKGAPCRARHPRQCCARAPVGASACVSVCLCCVWVPALCVFASVRGAGDYTDTTVTENTRCAYPLEHIPYRPRRCEHTHAHRTRTRTRTRCCRNAKLPALTDTHLTNVILLTCDGFGVLPPVSKLTRGQACSAPPRAHRDRRWRRRHAPVRASTSRTAQAIYHFIQGYTSKMAGTEVSIFRRHACTHACTHAHAQVGISETTAAFSSCYGEPFLVW